jgi:hypothetical protein
MAVACAGACASLAGVLSLTHGRTHSNPTWMILGFVVGLLLAMSVGLVIKKRGFRG